MVARVARCGLERQHKTRRNRGRQPSSTRPAPDAAELAALTAALGEVLIEFISYVVNAERGW